MDNRFLEFRCQNAQGNSQCCKFLFAINPTEFNSRDWTSPFEIIVRCPLCGIMKVTIDTPESIPLYTNLKGTHVDTVPFTSVFPLVGVN